MKDRKRSTHRKRNIILLLLLAALCIGISELAACYWFAPALYQQITAPVRQAVAAMDQWRQETVDSALAYAARLRDDLAAMLEKPPEQPAEEEIQLAGQPTLETHTPISDPAVTEITVRENREILTGGIMEIVYFNQGEEPWAEESYGTDDIGHYGCGPTVMAMVVASMTDTETDPAAMSQWAVDHGYWARKSGSYHSIVQGTAQAFGLEADSFSGRTPDDFYQALDSGSLLVALVGPGHFTNGGHFILLRGVTLTGDILVADPNSSERSLITWDPQLILDELSKSTSYGAPLWIISKSDS